MWILVRSSDRGELSAQTLEKYQHIFTHDLHLSDSCCDEGHQHGHEALSVNLDSLPLNLSQSFDKHSSCADL